MPHMSFVDETMDYYERHLFKRKIRQSRLPALYRFRYWAEQGGLIVYGIDSVDHYRRAAGYIARILQGAKPSELPIDQATKIELIINLKTAKTLGLTVPQILLAGADEVIE
jgi:putative tryptophan/tyrosine transport system substrate-binding protein